MPIPQQLLDTPFSYYLKRDRKQFSAAIFALFLTNLFDVLPPLLIARGIDQIEASRPSGEILTTTLILLGILVLTAVFRFTWRVLFGRFHHSVADDLRRRLFSHFAGLDPNYYSRTPVGESMSLITNDVNVFRIGVGPGVLILFDAVFLSALTIPMMIYIQPTWTWQTLIFLPVLPFLIRGVMKFIYQRFKRQQDAFSEMSGVVQEIISGIRIIKGYALEDVQSKKFNRQSRDYEESCNATARIDSLFEPVMEFGIASGSVILLYFCSSDVVLGTVTLGSFFAFHRYVQKMVWPMTAVGLGISHVQKARASFQRIRGLLETQSLIENGAQQLPTVDSLSVSNLDFAYPGENTSALSKIDFTLKKGQTLGVVGPVGSGKSTLAQLLVRLYPAPAHAIQINDTAIENYDLLQLRGKIRLVPQDPFLFSESITENINFAAPQDQSPEPVARSVRIHKEIMAIPGKYEAQLGERGINLSGGQKQRLTLARGLQSGAEVLILDDSLSAVDAKTEESIKTYLRETKDQTRIIISHRISSVQDADQILVLNQGKQEACGTHEQLISSSPTYRELVELQGGDS